MLALMQLASFYGNSAHVFTITEGFFPLDFNWCFKIPGLHLWDSLLKYALCFPGDPLKYR